jgi:hypothetical protein
MTPPDDVVVILRAQGALAEESLQELQLDPSIRDAYLGTHMAARVTAVCALHHLSLRKDNTQQQPNDSLSGHLGPPAPDASGPHSAGA